MRSNYSKHVYRFTTQRGILVFYKFLRLQDECWYSTGFVFEPRLLFYKFNFPTVDFNSSMGTDTQKLGTAGNTEGEKVSLRRFLPITAPSPYY